jgi:hypothetical protein
VFEEMSEPADRGFGRNSVTPDSDLGTRVLTALNHPLRIRILEALVLDNASASMLARRWDLPVNKVAYHLCKVIYEECDLVEVVAQYARRGAQETVFAARHECFAGLLLLQVAEAAEDLAGRHSPGVFTAVVTDKQGEREIGAALKQLGETVAEVGRRCETAGGRRGRLVIGAAGLGLPLPPGFGT